MSILWVTNKNKKVFKKSTESVISIKDHCTFCTGKQRMLIPNPPSHVTQHNLLGFIYSWEEKYQLSINTIKIKLHFILKIYRYQTDDKLKKPDSGAYVTLSKLFKVHVLNLCNEDQYTYWQEKK